MSTKKVAVITGASRGIGKAIAKKYAANGYNLAICCKTNSDLLKEVQEEILLLGADCICFTGDMAVPADVKQFFSEIYNHYSHVDVLINNAGISHVGLLTDMTDEEWDLIISGNLSSVFYCCREVAKDMINRRCGCIINISSVWGTYGASCEVAYSASKGGVNSFTKALSKELAPSNITVNAVACGIIDTDMNSHLSNEELSSIYEDIPAGRCGTVDEVANTVYSITSQSTYLTGQIITIDGGWF
ncbi:MAG: SDR family NAD(P)-dependent oxidoreductase [Lachnospiraceae bacterium]|nr:SDR family NAD(P)-dependent oxidoreductase [Lachnospiraceae bacterium]